MAADKKFADLLTACMAEIADHETYEEIVAPLAYTLAVVVQTRFADLAMQRKELDLIAKCMSELVSEMNRSEIEVVDKGVPDHAG